MKTEIIKYTVWSNDEDKSVHYAISVDGDEINFLSLKTLQQLGAFMTEYVKERKEETL